MWILAAFVTMVGFGVNNMIFKVTNSKGLSKVHIQFYFYLVAFVLMGVIGLIGGLAPFNWLTILLGASIGILNANGNIQMSKAFENGPASITSPLISMNAIIPVLSSALLFHEHIALWQWVGIFIMMASVMIIQYSPSKQAIEIAYRPWIGRTLLSLGSFGLLGVLMKTSTHLALDSLNILICMYGGGALYLFANSLLKKETWQRGEVHFGGLVGCISVIAYSSYFFALQSGVASIVFPIVSLNSLVVVCLSIYFFKEKLKSYQMAGILTALVGIALTKIE